MPKLLLASAVIAVGSAVASAATPGLIEPKTHLCLETDAFGDSMYRALMTKQFERKKWDWDKVLGQGPIPGQNVSFPAISVRTLPMETQVVDFTVDRVPEIKKSILKRTAVFKEIKDALEVQQELYHNYNLNFDNSILFVPEWVDYFKDNQATVLKTFPNAASVAANIFHVPKGAVPFGVHNAEHGSTAILRTSFAYWNRLTDMSANQHVSFHTAIEDQLTMDDEPLIIYEKTPGQVNNIGFMLRVMKTWASESNIARIDDALSAINSGIQSIQQPASNFITTQYLRSQYCPVTNPEGDGYWWPLKAGQALFFDNFLFHGASTVGPALKDRFTMDMRVTSYKLNSCDPTTYYHQNPLVAASFRKSKDCISKIFGYANYEHLLTVMYDKEIADACAHTPMFFFAINPKDINQGYVDDHLFITPQAIKNHVKFASSYFKNDKFTMPLEAKECIQDVTTTLKDSTEEL